MPDEEPAQGREPMDETEVRRTLGAALTLQSRSLLEMTLLAGAMRGLAGVGTRRLRRAGARCRDRPARGHLALRAGAAQRGARAPPRARDHAQAAAARLPEPGAGERLTCVERVTGIEPA